MSETLSPLTKALTDILSTSVEYRPTIKLSPVSNSSLDAYLPKNPSVRRNTRSNTEDFSLQTLVSINPLDLVQQKELEESNFCELPLKAPLAAYTRPHADPVADIASRPTLTEAATALTAGGSFLLIGTAHGSIHRFAVNGSEELVFEQRRKVVDAVLSLDVSPDERAALSTHANGAVVMWELASGKVLAFTTFKVCLATINFISCAKRQCLGIDKAGQLWMLEYSKAVFSKGFKVSQIEGIADPLVIGTLVNFKAGVELNCLVAIGSKTSVSVSKLDGVLKEFYNIMRPQAAAVTTPCLSWDGSRTTLLVVAWDSIVQLYDLRRMSRDSVHLLGSYHLDCCVWGVGFLQYDTVLLLTASRKAKIIRASEFTTAPVEQSSRSDVLMHGILADPLLFSTNTFKALPRTSYVLGKDSLWTCRLLDWRESLQHLVDASAWMDALTYGIDVYEGRAGLVCSHQFDPGEIRQELAQTISQFVRRATLPLDTKIEVTIEFCSKLKLFDVFFGEFFESFLDHGAGRQTLASVFDTLEPYILRGKIESIPPFILGRMMGHYSSVQKLHTLERIVLHLDPRSLEPQQLLPVCKARSLITCLIFLYTNSTQQSFLNPLNALFKLLLAQHNARSQRFCAYKLLWYVRMCLRGETFPNGCVLASQHVRALTSILGSLATPSGEGGTSRLGTLLKIDKRVTLGVLLEAFYGRTGDLLAAERPDLQLDLLQRLREELPGEYLLAVFQAQVAIESPGLMEDGIQLVKDIVRLSKLQTPRYYSGVDSIEKYVDIAAASPEVDPLQTIEAKSELILRLLFTLQLTDAQVDDIHKCIADTPYTEVLVYLLERKREFRQCVQVFLRSDKRHFKEKIFDWLGHAAEVLGELQFKAVLKREVMECLNVLVGIDSERTASFLRDWFHENHSVVIRQLESAPELQLKYLQEVLENPENHTEELVMKYLELLTEFAPAQVLSVLKSTDQYPKDTALELCKRKGILDATAYLYEAVGEVRCALEVLLNRIEAKMQASRDMSAIQSDITEAYELCKRHERGFDESDYIDMWFPLIGTILDTYQQTSNKCAFELLLGDSVKKVLENMLHCIQFDKILEFLNRKYGEIPFTYFKDMFVRVLSEYSFQTNTIRTAINLLNNDIQTMTQNLYAQQTTGISSSTLLCVGCGGPLHQNLATASIEVYICGHMYHDFCNLAEECSVCSDQVE